jgi:hypothetical protein
MKSTMNKTATALVLSLLALVVMFPFLAPAKASAANTTLAISIDGGVLYFPGENAVFYFTTTANGNVVIPDNVSATLYFPNNVNNFVLKPVQVTTGVYMVNWTVPSNAVMGYYALVVYASYAYGTFGGLAVKGFEISQGIQNNQNQIMTGVGALSGQLSSVESNVLSKLFGVNSTAKSMAPAIVSSSLLLGALQSFTVTIQHGGASALFAVLSLIAVVALVLSGFLVVMRRHRSDVATHLVP